MLITILFLIASIALIIFTIIYTTKKNKFYSFEAEEKADVKKNKKTIKNIWNIDKIRDSIISTNDKYCRHTIIIELGSIEYRLLNEDEQNNIDTSLINISKTIANKTQFFSTIERIDTSKKIENIRQNLDKQKNNSIKEYGKSIIQYLENIMQEENLYVRKNYILISSNCIYPKAKLELMEIYKNLKHNLANIKVTAKILSDAEIIELLHRELNKNSTEKLQNILDKGGLDFYVTAKTKQT